MDIGIEKGKFKAIEREILSKGLKEFDAKGHLVTPPFVESHVHLDSALSAGIPRYNESGTLLKELKYGENGKNI